MTQDVDGSWRISLAIRRDDLARAAVAQEVSLRTRERVPVGSPVALELRCHDLGASITVRARVVAAYVLAHGRGITVVFDDASALAAMMSVAGG